MLHGRYIGFMENLSSTIKTHLQILFNLCKSDQSCNSGQNLTYLLNLYETFYELNYKIFIRIGYYNIDRYTSLYLLSLNCKQPIYFSRISFGFHNIRFATNAYSSKTSLKQQCMNSARIV